ncbi:MAG: hypothetical protein PHU56_04120, partial [Candidatus Pacebacteria bacterium]|nr:hypothetical protein [Candidatus Paceibacterota bacterium]
AAVIFLLVFSYCVIQPARADNFTLKAIRADNLADRLSYARKAVEVSPAGRYQIRDFFTEQFSMDIQRNIKDIMDNEAAKQGVKNILDFLTEQLEKSVEQSSHDYSATLRLAQTYNIYAYFDISKIALSEEYSQTAVALSPANPQSYWVLAQAQFYSGKYDQALASAQKAIDLEPKWFPSWAIAVQIAQRSGNQERAGQLARQALDLSLAAIDTNPDSLNHYQYAAQFASDLGLKDQVEDIARKAVLHNPEWQSEFAGYLLSTQASTGTSPAGD